MLGPNSGVTIYKIIGSKREVKQTKKQKKWVQKDRSKKLGQENSVNKLG